ncbi:MAG: PQQ-like beta-propeller repeat protein [Planctomycetes bacterium]|nr:PQQ-like beta-propeller repeat protein [Planctomycetota bacterium]
MQAAFHSGTVRRVLVLFGLCLLTAPATHLADDVPAVQAVREAKAAAAAKAAEDKKAAAEAAGEKKAVADDKPAAKADGEAAAKTEEKKPAVNPLGALIRNIFKPAEKPAGRIIPDNGGAMPAEGGEAADDKNQPINGDRTARDRIDARAPHDPEHAKLLRRAASSIETATRTDNATEWKRAMDVLQYVLERPEDSVIRLTNGKLSSVRLEANRMLGGLPARLLENYRTVYGGKAEQLLDEAQQHSDVAGIVEVATRYFHTAAGYEASNMLGAMHYDRGEFGMATYWFSQLLAAKAPQTRGAGWQLRAASAFRQAGDATQSREMMTQVASAGSPLQLGGKPVSPQEWLAAVGPLESIAAPLLSEWPMYLGTPLRTGRSVGGEPLLLPRWTEPLTYNRQVQEQLEMLVEDITDQGRATVPTFVPLFVDGKIIFRTLRSVMVADAESGRPLWETREDVSAEKMLSGQAPRQTEYMNRFGGGPVQMVSEYSGGNGENHQLASLMFLDGTYGFLSSDGQRLYTLEDHAIMLGNPQNYWGGWWNPAAIVDPYRRDRKSNRLVAYDLDTGRPLWAVGGQMMDEPFDLRLAGYYFYGTPTPDGGELFVVGEKDSEIRLFSLDPETGRPNWSQLVAYSDAEIEKDLGRRWWTAQVSVSGGMIVCPTTVGWLVAVDRLNHSVVWAQRFAKVQKGQEQQHRGREQNNMVQMMPLNQRWCPSAPIIAGSRVLFTPPEEQVIECLNLYDGERLWQKPKDSFLYVAGVFGDKAVFVGTDKVEALSLENGSSVWTLSIPVEEGRPNGYGVAVEDRYYLPLSTGQLWAIDPQKGEVLRKSFLREPEQSLGNLGMYRGMLVSLTPTGVTSFEQREAVETRIAERKTKDPHDAWALIREADIHLLNREHPQALESLRQVRPEEVAGDAAADLRERYREGTVDSLAAIIRSDLAAHDAAMDELASFAQSAEEKLLVRRLRALRLVARRQFSEAFDLYLELAAEDGSQIIERGDSPVPSANGGAQATPVTPSVAVSEHALPSPRIREGTAAGPSVTGSVTLRLDRWLAGQLQDLWEQAPEDVRRDLEARIAKRFEQAKEGSMDDRRRAVLLFGFHPHALELERMLVEDHATRGEFTEAENRLLRLAHSSDRRIAAAALERLARLLVRFDLSDDAGWYYRLLEARYGDVELEGGRTAGRLVAELREAGQLPTMDDRPARPWGDFDMKIESRGGGRSYNNSPTQELDPGSWRLPFFREYRFLYHPSQQHLAVHDADDHSLNWLLPLRTAAQSSQGNFVGNETSGHQMFLLHEDVVHSVSPVERRVLWTRPLGTRGRAGGFYRAPSRRNVPQMQQGTSLGAGSSLSQQAVTQGMMAVANARYVCTYGRREFHVIDALTGELLWTKGGIPVGTQVYGTEDTVFVIPRGDYGQTLALRALDGKQLDMPRAGELLAKAVRVSHEGIVVMDSSAARSLLGLTRRKTSVKLVEPVTGNERWKVEFPTGAYFALLDDARLAAIDADGKFSTLDLVTGESQPLGQVPAGDLKNRSSLYVIGDDDAVYLVVNQRRSGSRSFGYSSSLPSFEVNGQIVAFDRRAGKLAWKARVDNKRLVYSELNHSPVLLLVAQMYERNNVFSMWRNDILVLDKVTGRRLVEQSSLSNYSGFNWMTLNLADRFLELRTYNFLVRLTAVDRAKDKTSAQAPSVAPAPSPAPVQAPQPARAGGAAAAAAP